MGNRLYAENNLGIAFSGGGVCGLAHVGAMNAFAELGMHFDHFAGASVGSIIASLCALKTNQLEELMLFDFNELMDDDYGVIRDNIRLWQECGYYKGDVLYEKIRSSFNTVCGNPDVKFRDLTRELYIPVTQVWKSHCETKIYSKHTTPDESIALACRLSCTYPAFFRSLNSTSDGGILCNYPLHLLPQNSIGLRLVYPEITEQEPITNIAEYLSSIICTLHAKANTEIYDDRTINICVDIPSMCFSITQEQRLELIRIGYETVMKKYK